MYCSLGYLIVVFVPDRLGNEGRVGIPGVLLALGVVVGTGAGVVVVGCGAGAGVVVVGWGAGAGTVVVG
jgi:hypothetical protein